MNSATKPAPTVPCPICSKPALFSPANPFRPFCSERCKLIDLGQWASESYCIPVSEEESAKEENTN
jgi:endogenous inhibitor of DNA gyrase (YacG/DUF329 family)